MLATRVKSENGTVGPFGDGWIDNVAITDFHNHMEINDAKGLPDINPNVVRGRRGLR